MSRAFAGAFVVLSPVCAVGACTDVTGLDQYKDCAHGCSASAEPDAQNDGATVEGAQYDGTTVDGARNDGEVRDALGSVTAASDGPSADVGSDPGATDAGTLDSGDAGQGDAGPSDAGPTCPAVTDLEGGALLIYYPFEENTADRSGNGDNGVATTGSDISYMTGKLGEGIAILAGGHGVKVMGSTELSGPKTLCAWIDPGTGATGQAMPVFVSGVGSTVNYYDLEPAMSPSAGGCTVSANTLFMDNGACSTSTLTVAPGTWNFVCFAYTGSSTTFFANGSTRTVSGAEYDPYTLAQITIGSDLIGGSTTQALFDGLMDEVSVWSGALSTSDMNGLYNQGNGCRIR